MTYVVVVDNDTVNLIGPVYNIITILLLNNICIVLQKKMLSTRI